MSLVYGDDGTGVISISIQCGKKKIITILTTPIFCLRTLK